MTLRAAAETENPMIQATIRMTVPPSKIPAVLEILRPVAELSRDDPGCLSCHVYVDQQDKNVLMLEQVWGNGEDMDRHLRSDEYRNLLLALEFAAKRPEIRFDTISSSAGLETVEKARGQAG